MENLCVGVTLVQTVHSILYGRRTSSRPTGTCQWCVPINQSFLNPPHLFLNLLKPTTQLSGPVFRCHAFLSCTQRTQSIHSRRYFLSLRDQQAGRCSLGNFSWPFRKSNFAPPAHGEVVAGARCCSAGRMPLQEQDRGSRGKEDRVTPGCLGLVWGKRARFIPDSRRR